MKLLYALSLVLYFSIAPAFSQQGDNLEENFDNTARDLGGKGTQLEPLSADEFGNAKQDNKPAINESFVSKMMTGVMKKAVNEFLKENPFSKMDRAEVKSMIEVRTQGLPVSKLFQKNPKILDMLVDWLRDKKALPSLMGIVNKPDEVKIYGIIVTVIFVLSFMLNLVNSKGNLLRRIFRKIGIFLGAMTVNIGAFAYLFSEEIKPSLDIVWKYYHF